MPDSPTKIACRASIGTNRRLSAYVATAISRARCGLQRLSLRMAVDLTACRVAAGVRRRRRCKACMAGQRQNNSEYRLFFSQLFIHLRFSNRENTSQPPRLFFSFFFLFFFQNGCYNASCISRLLRRSTYGRRPDRGYGER